MNNEFIRPISAVEAAIEGIRSSIIKGELRLGQQLTESYLKIFWF
jgi:DNA-binding GntR family transcriptional regulator